MLHPRTGFLLVMFAAATNSAWALPNVLNASAHADIYIAPAIQAMLGAARSR